MARSETAILDGLVVGYGTRDTKNSESSGIRAVGRTQELTIQFDFNQVSDFAIGVVPTAKDMAVPIGAAVLSAKLVVLSALTGLTVTTGRLAVGLRKADGTALVSKGLIGDTAEAALATGETVEGAGSVVDGVVLTEDGFPSIEMTGVDPTAGEAHLVVEYVETVPSNDSPAVITGIIGTL